MKSFPPNNNGAPRPSQEKPSRPPRPAAPTVEIGLLLQIHTKGFGFAQPLTGNPRTTVFLNESRITALRALQPEPEGTLIRMSVADKADGKRAATEARPLQLDDALAAQCLWDRLGQDRASPDIQPLKPLLPAQPVLLPLLLVLLAEQPAGDSLLPALAAQLPAGLWQEPALARALHLAPRADRRAAIQHHLQQRPDTALALLRSGASKPGQELDIAWLETLWQQLPSERSAILDLAKRAQGFRSATEKLTWARRGIDYGGAQTWWDQIASVIAAPAAPWPQDWDQWPALADAPTTLIQALAQHRHPAYAQATQLLAALPEWTAQHARFDADELLQALNDQDKALARQWISTPLQPEIERPVLAQMQTARAAEKCVLRYFHALGLDASDVSIGQLSGQHQDWLQMDLQINQRHGVDVKNCRRSLNGGMRSGRWKVKAFKADAAGKAVTLCGVSSPHTRFEQDTLTAVAPKRTGYASFTAAQPVPMFVLGVTHAAELRNLIRRFRDVSDIHMPSRERLLEMPVWAWDYPLAHYQPRNDALGALRKALLQPSPTVLEQRLRHELPPALWSLLDLDAPPHTPPLEEQQQEFLTELRQHWRLTRGAEADAPTVPRLAWLYLFSLHLWLRRRSAGKTSAARTLEAPFRPRATPASTPTRSVASEPVSLASGIGIADPARAFEQLLETLAVLDQHLPPAQFVGITQFTLYPNGIFIGRFPDGQRKTLLAHCGGTVEKLMVDCGNWPLVYGKESSCACGRLICKECLCCSDAAQEPCPHQLERQAQARQARETSAAPRSSSPTRRRSIRWSEPGEGDADASPF